MLAFNVQNKRFGTVLIGLICVNILFVIWTLFYSSIIVSDDVEHLRAAYFVSLGEVPYRDFFEHHHPLLWYVFAPIVKHFSNLLRLLFFAIFALYVMCYTHECSLRIFLLKKC